MIGRLRGTVLETSGNLVTIDVGGVGYEVLVPDSVLVHVGREGAGADLRIRQVFREDGVTLYGFAEPGQRRLFDLLMEVKGCGPKIGLALLGQLGEETVTAAIAGQDARQLARATGVGPRLAERIILELKDKIAEEVLLTRATGSKPKATPDDEVVEALIALGYRRNEAESAADSAGSEGTVEERIRAALRVLGKK
jgi:Holliday junction DNA helicase RuvA